MDTLHRSETLKQQTNRLHIRLFPVVPVVAMILVVMAGMMLTGCESEGDRKLAEVRDKMQEQQIAEIDKQAAENAAKMGTGKDKPTESDDSGLGIPVYPGAESILGNERIKAPSDDEFKTALMQTSDSFEKVVAFYKEKLPIGVKQRPSERDGSPSMTFTQELGSGGLKVVQIRQVGEKTVLELMNLGTPNNSDKKLTDPTEKDSKVPNLPKADAKGKPDIEIPDPVVEPAPKGAGKR